MRRSAERRRDIARIFLETSIQIQRFLEVPLRRAVIRQNLLGKQLYTSSYVRMEFQKTLLKDLRYVRSTVASDCATIDGKVFLHLLLDAVQHRRPGHSQRAVQRSIKIVRLILEIFPETQVKRWRLLEFLDGQIDQLWDGFEEANLLREGGGVVQVECSNATDCDLPRTGKNTCRREDAHCQLPILLARHADVFEQVRHAFAEAASDHGSHQASLAVERVFGPRPLDCEQGKGQRNCWPLGDTIIALEAPPDAAIYTIDRHFEVICPIVGRFLYEEHADDSPTPAAAPA